MSRRVVVTGGAGFLGSHLCEALLARGDEVVCLDNLVTGNIDNVAHLFGEDGFSFVRHDVSNHIWVPGPVDQVMHLASPASPIDFARIPIQILKVGSLGTHNGLGLAKEKGARFFFASTSEVYGDPAVHPQPETYWGNVNPIGPRGVYDEAKRFSEALTMAYHRAHDLEVRIVRIFNTYGPRMRPDDGRVVSNFITPGPPGGAHHDLRRRLPDPELLLRRRSDPGSAGPPRRGAHRPDQYRQRCRVLHAGAGRGRARSHQQQEPDRFRPPAHRRSDPPPPGSHRGHHEALVEAHRPPCGRGQPNGGVLRVSTRR